MQTFRRFEAGQDEIPAAVAWYLADLGEAREKQELFRRQSPQMLKVLRKHAIIESAVSSNRIEGVTMDQARVQTVLFGKSQLRDRTRKRVAANGTLSSVERFNAGGKIVSEERSVVRADDWFSIAEGELVEEVIGLGRDAKTLTVLSMSG